VEKPLCLRREELVEIVEKHEKTYALDGKRPTLMVGYNRRFAPLTLELQARLAGRQRPLAMIFTCNAGAVPADHWVQDPLVGGGRILGEACHFIDLMHFLADCSPITHVAALECGAVAAGRAAETVSISLRFQDGSLGQLNYFANGSRSYPKERLEVFSEGRTLCIDNFRRLRGYGLRRANKKQWTQNKGHNEEFLAFVQAVRDGGESPITFESLANTTAASLAIVEALERRSVVEVHSPLQEDFEPLPGSGPDGCGVKQWSGE
jgi:predicted dehydrogenase